MGVTFLPCKHCGEVCHEDDILKMVGCECRLLICVWCFEKCGDSEYIKKTYYHEDDEPFCETCVFCENQHNAKESIVKLKELHNELFKKKKISKKLYDDLIKHTNNLKII